MRIAFGSCCRFKKDPVQAVWDSVRGQQPDHLVLLGDLIYMDFGLKLFGGNLYEPLRMSLEEFTATMYGHYRAQYGVASFRRLLESMPPGGVHCTWDDHDFAWNNAVGGRADAKHAVPLDKRLTSRELFEQYRDALAARPAEYPPPPEWPAVRESVPDRGGVHASFDADGVRFIVLDERTWADLPGDNAELIGEPGTPQDLWLVEQLRGAGDEVVICSSATISSGTCWRDYPNAWRRLQEMLQARKVLFLSGDVHVNALRSHGNAFGGTPIHEATSSGLAITGYKPGYFGALSNHGLLEISPAHIAISLYRDNGKPDGAMRIRRSDWQLA